MISILFRVLRRLLHLEDTGSGSSTQPEMSTNDCDGLVVSFKDHPVNETIFKKIIVLQIRNESTRQRFYYKIKSNANKRSLAVTSNRGIIEHDQVVESVLTLKCNGTIDWKRYKMLVQYIPARDGEKEEDLRNSFQVRCRDLRETFLDLAPITNQKRLMFKRTVEYFEGEKNKGTGVRNWEPEEAEQLNLHSQTPNLVKVQGSWNAKMKPATSLAKKGHGTAPFAGQNVDLGAKSSNLRGQGISSQAPINVEVPQRQDPWGQGSCDQVQDSLGQNGGCVQKQWGQGPKAVNMQDGWGLNKNAGTQEQDAWGRHSNNLNQEQNGCGNGNQLGRGLNGANQDQVAWGSNENAVTQDQDPRSPGSGDVNQAQNRWCSNGQWGQGSNAADHGSNNQIQDALGQNGGCLRNQRGQSPSAGNIQQDGWGSNENADSQSHDVWGRCSSQVNQAQNGWCQGGGVNRNQRDQGPNAANQEQDSWNSNENAGSQDRDPRSQVTSIVNQASGGWGRTDAQAQDQWGQGYNNVDQVPSGLGQGANGGIQDPDFRGQGQIQDVWDHQKQQNDWGQATSPKCEEKTAVGGSFLNQSLNDFQGSDLLCLFIIPVSVFVFGLILGKAGL